MKKLFKKLLIALYALGLALTPSLSVQAAVTIVQHHENGVGGASIGVALSATGAGNLLVTLVTIDDAISGCAQISTVSDGTTNFTRDNSATATASSGPRTEVWYILSSTAGRTTITVTPSAPCAFDAYVYEVSGVSTWAIDKEAILSDATGSGTSYPGAAVTPSSPQIGFGVIAMSSNAVTANPAAGNEFTAGGDIGIASAGASAALVTTSATAHTPSWTGNVAGGNYAASTIFFKNAIANVPKFIVYNSSAGRKIRLFEGFKIKLQ